MVQSPFSKKASWRVYNQLFWNSSFDPELEKTAEKIAKVLFDSNQKAPSTSPINVLILGIGTGTLEFPLLASIERKTGRKVNITGIDLHREPLLFTQYLLDRGLENIPKDTSDLIKQLDGYDWGDISNDEFNYETWAVGDHRIICDDLDYERINYRHNQNIITTHRPSQWADRIRDNNLIPNNGFDIVLTSFFLTHVDWWRTTLASALSFVEKGSLFMYSSGQGDTRLLEGQSNLRHKNNSIFTDILLNEDCGYFAKEGIKDYKSLPKPINAIRSFALEILLNYWQYDGLEEYNRDQSKDKKSNLLGYKIINSVDFRTCINMLKNRTFSAFRTIDSLIGIEKNNEAIREIEENFCGNTSGKDKLEFDIKWHIYIRKDKPAKNFYFNRRLIGNGNKHSHEKKENAEIKLFQEYEWWTAWNEPISEKEQLGTLEKSTLSENTARYFNFKGVLNSACIGGVIRDLEETSNTEFKYFVNYLYEDVISQEEYLKDLYFYLNSRKAEHSNTSILLSSVIPISNKPCIFVYKSSDKHIEGIDVELIEHSSFDEIRFSYPEELLKLLPIDHGFSLAEISENTSTEKITFSMKLEQENILERNVKKIKNCLKEAGVNLQLNFKKIDFGFDPIIKKLEDALNEEVLFTVWSVFVIKEVKMIITYPFIYHFDNKPKANRAILLFYNSPLYFGEIDQEYIKINLMYTMGKGPEQSQKDGDRKGSIIGKIATMKNFAHEIRSINIFCESMFNYLIEAENISLNCEDNAFLKKIGLAAHGYIDFWATENTKTTEAEAEAGFLLNKGSFKNVLFKDAKYIAFIKSFHKMNISRIISHRTHIEKMLDCAIEFEFIFEGGLRLNSKVRKALMAILVNSIYHCIEFYRNKICEVKDTLEVIIEKMSTIKMCLYISISANTTTSAFNINTYNECDCINTFDPDKDSGSGTKAVIKSVLAAIGNVEMYHITDTNQINNSKLKSAIKAKNELEVDQLKKSLYCTHLEIY